MVSKVKRRNLGEWIDDQPKILHYLASFVALILFFTTISIFVYHWNIIENGKMKDDMNLQIENYGYTIGSFADQNHLIEECIHGATVVIPVTSHKQGSTIDKITMHCIAKDRYHQKVIVSPYEAEFRG